MHFSYSSLLITLAMTLLMFFLLDILLKQKNKFFLFRTDFFIVLSLIILLRLALPFELPFTISLYISSIMNPVSIFLNFEIYNGFLISHLLGLIWFIGSLILFILYIQKLSLSKCIFKKINKASQKMHICDFMKVDKSHNYEIWKTDLINTPMVLGFKKVILMPNYTLKSNETHSILLHEMQHIKHHDIYIKHFVNILLIIYWWFIPIYWLSKNIDLVLEIRADDKATKRFSEREKLQYAAILIGMERKIQDSSKHQSLSTISNCFIREGKDILSYRIRFLTQTHFNKKTNIVFLCLIFLLPLLSNSIILEADFGNPKTEEKIISEENLNQGYILCHDDGSYSFILNDFSAKISNPNADEFINLPRLYDKGDIQR